MILKSRCEMILGTTSGCYKRSSNLGLCHDSARESHDAIEERMQSANKAFWKDILIFKSKDVPWKVKCQRL